MEKHLTITGTSTVSWKDAILQTIAETAKTVNNIKGIKIITQRAKIEDQKIAQYYVDLDLTFEVDKNRE